MGNVRTHKIRIKFVVEGDYQEGYDALVAVDGSTRLWADGDVFYGTPDLLEEVEIRFGARLVETETVPDESNELPHGPIRPIPLTKAWEVYDLWKTSTITQEELETKIASELLLATPSPKGEEEQDSAEETEVSDTDESDNSDSSELIRITGQSSGEGCRPVSPPSSVNSEDGDSDTSSMDMEELSAWYDQAYTWPDSDTDDMDFPFDPG